MNKNKEINLVKTKNFSSESHKKYDNQDEKNSILKILDLLAIKEEKNISFADLKKIVSEKDEKINAAIFQKNLTILESIVKHLKDDKNLNFSKISKKIGRDERNIRQIYNSAHKKHTKKAKTKFSESEIEIPTSIISDKKLSAMEAVVTYLKNNLNLSYHKIAMLLHRDDRTIWTAYTRAKQKNEK